MAPYRYPVWKLWERTVCVPTTDTPRWLEEKAKPLDPMSSSENRLSAGGKPMAGYLYAIGAAILWGIGGPVAKHLFNEGVTALVLTQMRQTLSFLLLMTFFLVARRDLARIRLRDIPYLMTMGMAGLALVQISYYSAIARIQVAAAILLQYMAPIVILLFAAAFMKEKLTPTKLLSLLLAVGGCALVAGAYNIRFLTLNLGGVAWGLTSAVCFAFYTLYGQMGLRKYPPMTLFAYSCGFGSIVWWVLNPPQSFFSIAYSPMTWLAFLYVAVLGTIVPFILYFKSLERMEASRVSITSTLEPVVAGVIAYVFIGEKMGFLQVVGGMLVLAGIILLQQSPSPELAHRPVQDGGVL
jgi:drug/metabolite transporter (DMT)-like permease